MQGTPFEPISHHHWNVQLCEQFINIILASDTLLYCYSSKCFSLLSADNPKLLWFTVNRISEWCYQMCKNICCKQFLNYKKLYLISCLIVSLISLFNQFTVNDLKDKSGKIKSFVFTLLKYDGLIGQFTDLHNDRSWKFQCYSLRKDSV